MSSVSLRSAAVLAALALPVVGHAQSLRGTAVPTTSWSGSRGATELRAGGVYASSAFSIGWSITPTDAGQLLYAYTISGLGGRGAGLSHLILGLGGSDAPTATVVSGGAQGTATGQRGSYSSTAQGRSNPGLVGTLTGVKWNVPGAVSSAPSLTLSFLSSWAPVWGDVYAKGGQGYAENLAQGSTSVPVLGVATSFVAVPGSVRYTPPVVTPPVVAPPVVTPPVVTPPVVTPPVVTPPVVTPPVVPPTQEPPVVPPTTEPPVVPPVVVVEPPAPPVIPPAVIEPNVPPAVPPVVDQPTGPVIDAPTAPTTAVVPEPATVALLGTGLLGLAAAARARRRRD